MDALELTYERYGELGGRLAEEAFSSSLPAACAYVRDVVGFNEPMDDAEEAALERAVCGAIKVDQAYGATGGIGEGARSVSIGRYSESAGSGGGASAYEADMVCAIRRELAGTSLLYQGIA